VKLLLLWTVLVGWDVPNEIHGNTRVCIAAKTQAEALVQGRAAVRAFASPRVVVSKATATNDGCHWMPDDTGAP
jgi:hypothetical protein